MFGYNALDVGIIIVVIFGALYGSYRGFVVSLLSFAGKILSAILAINFLEKFISIFKIKELFMKGVVDIVKDYLPMSDEIKNMKFSEEGVNIAGSSFENNAFAKIMGENISREIKHLAEAGERFSFETVGDMMGLIVANYIINIVSFIILFLLFLLGFSLLKAVLVKIIGLSDIVTGVDKFLGLLFGTGVNVFLLAFVLGFSYDILNLMALEDGSLLSKYRYLLNESTLQSYFYNVYSLIISEGTKLL